MKKYDTYKDSGIEWIGELPNDWDVKKIKHRCYVKARVGWKGLKSDEFLTDGCFYLVTGSDFKNDSVNWNECYHIDKDRYEEDPYIQLQEDDLLITKDGTIGKLAIVNELDKPACLNSGIFVVRSTNEDFKTEFLFWVLKSKAFKQFNDYTSYGSTIQHLYQNVFVEFAFPFPKPEEQTAIATYLDRKTAEIDELIADKKRLLELYEEEKTVIINQAVTKGINSDVSMKDSGIEWLGKIPEHWEVKKLIYIAKLNSGATPNRNNPNFWRGNIPWIKTGEVNYSIITKTEEYISDEGFKNSSTKLAPEGTLLMAMYGQGITRGKVALLGIPATYNQACCAIQFEKDLLNRYGFYFFKMAYDYIRDDGNETSQMNISTGYISSLKIVVPPLVEQQSIVQYIETECERFDLQVERTRKLIDLLKEYREAMISEVVTGQIKVID